MSVHDVVALFWVHDVLALVTYSLRLFGFAPFIIVVSGLHFKLATR